MKDSQFRRGSTPSCPENTWTRRGFLALGAGMMLSACRPQSRSVSAGPRVPRPNVVVFLADTLRADHLGCYGYPQSTSPYLDAFSRGSILFEKCYSQCCWTKPSIASLFTGVAPRVHQAGISQWDVRELTNLPVQVLRDSFTTLAEVFQAMGYRTALLQANPHVRKEFGFAKGFDHYQYRLSWRPAVQADAAVEWMKQAKEPFFLFIHEIDPHAPYEPAPERFQRLYGMSIEKAAAALPAEDQAILKTLPRLYGAGRADAPGNPRQAFRQLSEAGLQHLHRLYAAEISRVDDQFARIVGAIEEHGQEDRTIIVFTSDHGESFGEHGFFFHANHLFDEEVHVPLLIRLPQPMRRPVRVPHSVGLFDLYPTLLTLADGLIPDYVQGHTLLGSDGTLAVDRHRHVFANMDNREPEKDEWHASMILGPWKVYRQKNEKALSIFNRANDPGEKHDLCKDGRPADKTMESLIARFHAARDGQIKLADTFGPPVWTQGTAEHREELNALGYL